MSGGMEGGGALNIWNWYIYAALEIIIRPLLGLILLDTHLGQFSYNVKVFNIFVWKLNLFRENRHIFYEINNFGKTRHLFRGFFKFKYSIHGQISYLDTLA